MDLDFSFLVPVLALVTLLAVCIFALVSKARVERLRHDDNAPTSSLAKDSVTGGPFNSPAPESLGRRF
jgi:uncharacterized membrane protein